MKRPAILTAVIATVSILAAPSIAAAPPASWDGLAQVKSKQFDLVYLQPGADFRGYTKVLVEPTEVAFAKNWQRDHNAASRGFGSRISDRDVQEAISRGVKAAHDIFTAAWSKGGYAVVTEPGPDVLRIKTGIVNITVTAPDRAAGGRSISFAREAGSATLFVEARDSATGALLGRVVDQRIVGANRPEWSTAASNRAYFREMVKQWARNSVRGVTELKSVPATSP